MTKTPRQVQRSRTMHIHQEIRTPHSWRQGSVSTWVLGRQSLLVSQTLCPVHPRYIRTSMVRPSKRVWSMLSGQGYGSNGIRKSPSMDMMWSSADMMWSFGHVIVSGHVVIWTCDHRWTCGHLDMWTCLDMWSSTVMVRSFRHGVIICGHDVVKYGHDAIIWTWCDHVWTWRGQVQAWCCHQAARLRQGYW